MTALVDARAKLAAVLAPVADTDPAVLADLVDSIDPPALMLGWGEPWLDPMGACRENGRLVVTAVAGRLVPGAGVAVLEELVAFALGRLRSDPAGGAWPLEQVSGPRVFTIGGVNYLAARIAIRHVVT